MFEEGDEIADAGSERSGRIASGPVSHARYPGSGPDELVSDSDSVAGGR